MFDLRPIGYVIGFLVTVLGLTMLLPMILDIVDDNRHWVSFATSALISIIVGMMMAASCANSARRELSIQQTFLLTSSVWLVLPIFGALPFFLGEPELRVVDAFFEAMSGMTTTGATVLYDIEEFSRGILIWRGILQWLGGIGIIIVALAFLPELRVGGMQIFKSEGFDTLGKILPRAGEIAQRISVTYLLLTLICALAYIGSGMEVFDAVVHSMTTISTGGFSNYDISFAKFNPLTEYFAVFFMLLAALPFVRFVQLMSGKANPLVQDSQVRAFFLTVLVLVLCLTLWKMYAVDLVGEEAFRKALFNTVSLLTGTGYVSGNYMEWGGFAITLLFITGLIGGCAGSTSCSIKIFRYQLLFASVRVQLRRMRSPNGVFMPQYEGRTISDDVLNSVMSFFVFFLLSLGVISVALSLTGQDFLTSVSGAAATLANIGPGLGDQIGPEGNFSRLNDTAKWVLIFSMFIGRLELLAVFAIFNYRFWRL
ncbi:MAG: TrkH family potassium uptake protein [Aestuariivita sp.]|nr:TrkH family potassium uptake protein [Aestuariivita sp.]